MAMKFPLGSGLFDYEPEPSPFPLGSGLYGQPALSRIAPQSMMGGDAAPGAQGSDNTLDSRFLKMIDNPMFQFGINLLGSSNTNNPWGGALQGTLAAQAQSAKGKREAKRMELDEQQQQQQAAQHAARLEYERQHAQQTYDIGTRNAGIGEQRNTIDLEQLQAQKPLWEAQTRNYGAQAGMEQQKMEMQAAQAQREAAMQKFIMEQMGGGGGGLMAPQGAPQIQPLPTPQMQPQSGAPRSGGPNTPMNWGQINAAYAEGHAGRENDRVTILKQELANETNLENRAALQRELLRMNVQAQAPAQAPMQPPQGGAGADPSLKLGKLGALASIGGIKGGPQILDYAKMTQPQSMSPGALIRSPVDGSITQLPDPMGQKRLELDERRTQVTESGENRQVQEAGRKVESKVADLDAGYRAAERSLTKLEQAATELAGIKDDKGNVIQKGHPGLDTVGGISGFVGLHKLPGKGYDAAARLETLKSNLVVGAMTELKKLSETGSTGFGQLSEKEGERLETLVTNLKAAQSDEQLRKAVGEVAQFARESKALHKQHYESLRKAQGVPGAPAGADAGTPAGVSPAAAPIPLADFLKSRRAQRTDTPISPREARGVITTGR